MPDTHEQFLFQFDDLGSTEAIDFAILETHVVDGVFCPPLKEGDETIRDRRPRRALNKVLHDEVIPASLLSYNPAILTYKTTMRRLQARGHLFNTLITIREVTDEETQFRLVRVARSPCDWLAMHFRSKNGRRLVVINTDARGSEDDVAVTRDGAWWVAQFGFSPENRRRIEVAGFRFCPEERRWQTRDIRIAAILDPALRAEIQRSESEAAKARVVPRRAVFGRR